MNMNMFCYQCQEAAANEGCTTRGVCGKTPDVAHLQDLLLWLLRGLSICASRATEEGISDTEVGRFIGQALFATVTNVNFDPARFAEWVERTLELRERMRGQIETAPPEGLPEMVTWMPETEDLDELIEKGSSVGVLAEPDLDEDVRSLRELLTYGLKGLAAYTDHARILGYTDDALFGFLREGLLITTDDEASVDELVGKVLECGEMGVRAMALLDEANTSTFGHPEPTEVNLAVGDRPGILVSGHDLLDLAELLQQTEGTGVDVYTHGEMLPANAYPAFKRYSHLVGNYGGSWWHQREEFEKFNGAILMTTNCLVGPRDSYRDRIFTTGLVGWPGLKHIPDRENGGQKDFSPVVQVALESESPEQLETGAIPIGFAHNAVLSMADNVVEAVKSGALKRFVVMAGCDGRHRTREYYTEVAEALPDDTAILTAGCAKYRYNKLDLGEVDGIPRILDAGQCNDSYSLVVIAQKLAEAFGVDDLNELPISYDLAWYEQKAVIVLLALLSLGVKHIRLGPTLPAFVSAGVQRVLVEKLDLKPTETVEQDVAAILAGE